mgnify:CR=1 FL=1
MLLWESQTSNFVKKKHKWKNSWVKTFCLLRHCDRRLPPTIFNFLSCHLSLILKINFHFCCFLHIYCNFPLITLSEYLKLCQKNQFQKNSKFWIWIFELKCNYFWEFLSGRFTWIIWIFAPKIMILFKDRFKKVENCWILTVFGVKIQILIEINAS